MRPLSFLIVFRGNESGSWILPTTGNFSILARCFTDLVIQPGRKRNEYSAFCQMVGAASSDGPIAVYICGRGYATYNNYAHVIENGQRFLIRCTDARTEALLGNSLENIHEMDVHIERILSRSKAKKRMNRPELAAR